MAKPLKCCNEKCPLVGTTEAGRCGLCKRYICNAEAPYDKATMKGGSIHPQAYEVGLQTSNWPSGDSVRMECPVCFTRWEMELPQ